MIKYLDHFGVEDESLLGLLGGDHIAEVLQYPLNMNANYLWVVFCVIVSEDNPDTFINLLNSNRLLNALLLLLSHILFCTD